jgi:TrmH family RNA methyltransferase
MVITSVQNPRVKAVVALQQKSAERRRTGLFVVEGRREVEHCVEMGLEVVEVFVCEELGGWSCDNVAANRTEGMKGVKEVEGMRGVKVAEVTRGVKVAEVTRGVKVTEVTRGVKVTEVTRGVYEKMAYRGGTEGVMAVVKSKERRLDELDLNENPLIVVVERVEKPGNLGAILRSADAAGADAVVVCDPLTDLWNPNLIRSSIGAVFTVPCMTCGSEECIEFLKAHGIQILTAQLQDSELYYDTDMRRGTAIVMGTEATGLTDVWREAADAHIRIPMLGRLDSLNVSVSAAILLYEAVRQRGGTQEG